MTKTDWEKLKHFSPKEAWGNPSEMSLELLLALDDFRDRMGERFIVNCGYATSGHSPDSFHYKGEAVDGLFEFTNIFEQFFEALREDSFKGIGIYPFSKRPFLHLDIRPTRVKLIWYRDRGGSYHYNFSLKQLYLLGGGAWPS